MDTNRRQHMRADARRNYDSLVAVARKHLSNQGVTTSLEAIAREAGVGVGTLYRHFPDREHLIVAALNAQGESLRAEAERIRRSVNSAQRLSLWMEQVEQYLSSYQGLPDSIAHALECGEKSPLAISCFEIVEITEGFLREAKGVGNVREEVTSQALFESMLMISWLGSQVSDQQRDLWGVREIFRSGYLVGKS